MSFDYTHIDLPIVTCIAEIQEQLALHNTLILNAPPGAGKSTLVPLALLNQSWLNNKKIIVLEPRRLATKGIALRLAELLNEKVGETVGYRIRFETKVNSKTRIEVVTEGILTRMLHSDNALEDVGMVIFDEFHERSIHADVAMAFARESQQVLRPDLRLLIMSATLNTTALSEQLEAPVVKSEGRQYPVDVHYGTGVDLHVLPELMTETIVSVTAQKEGDLLAFLPGQAEISKCEALLRKRLPQFAVLPLYGLLPQNRQKKALHPHPEGKRKIVLATSIAETSLTIPGIRIVVDSGLTRGVKFDSRSGLSKLETLPITVDAADQRKGRAGRLEAGTCYRLWSKATHQQLHQHRRPEILESDLASLYLDLAEWSIEDPQQLFWLDAPPVSAVNQAKEILTSLGAIEQGAITAHGKQLHRLPCHPRIAHMLIQGKEQGLAALATDTAAVLEVRDPLTKEAGIDINLRIEQLRKLRRENRISGKWKQIESLAANYRKMLQIDEENTPYDPYETGVLVAHAYPERIACSRPGNNAQFQLANGRYAMAGHRDDLAHDPWLAVAHVQTRDRAGKIFLAAPLNPQDLAPLVKEREQVKWDSNEGKLQAAKEIHIGSIVLQSTPIPEPDESQLIQIICDVLRKEGKQLLNFDKTVEQLQNRVTSLRLWRPEENWPNFKTEELLSTCSSWLSPYLAGITKGSELKKLDLSSILKHALDWEQQNQLDACAPATLEVPSGSKIKLKYGPNGETPVLAVRIQELFGLGKTPHINDGNTAVLIHLLSPGFKPVQITSDLENFWNETYFEVRKELKRRYPKHAWPDEPWLAEATAKIKRKKP